MADELNYFGAAIFWLYILAALLFTGIVLQTIVSIPNPRSLPSPCHSILPFSLLALVSFATLSFNMLHVLFDSFSLWSLRHPSVSPLSPSSLVPLLTSIYSWSTTSTLFHDFAASIVSSPPRALWTHSALLATLYQSFAMALRGRELRLPNLWAFFALAQILPISFAQNLFYVAVVRMEGAAGVEGGPRMGRGRRGASVPVLDALVVLGVYGAALGVAPWVVGRGTGVGGVDWLIWTILGARMLLLLPYFMVRANPAIRGGRVGLRWVGESIVWQGVFAFVLRLGWFLVRGGSIWEVASALFEHPAVTTLGMDFSLSMVGLEVWSHLRKEPVSVKRHE